MRKTLRHIKIFFQDKFGIFYTTPKNYISLDRFYVMWKVRETPAKHSGNMYGPIFLSRDKECMIAFPAQLTNFLEEYPTKKKENVFPNYPRNQIVAEIKTSLGLYYSYSHPSNNDSVKIAFYDYVTVVSGKKPREMFNADSVFIYDLPNADSVFFFDDKLEKMRKKKVSLLHRNVYY